MMRSYKDWGSESDGSVAEEGRFGYEYEISSELHTISLDHGSVRKTEETESFLDCTSESMCFSPLSSFNFDNSIALAGSKTRSFTESDWTLTVANNEIHEDFSFEVEEIFAKEDEEMFRRQQFSDKEYETTDTTTFNSTHSFEVPDLASLDKIKLPKIGSGFRDFNVFSSREIDFSSKYLKILYGKEMAKEIDQLGENRFKFLEEVSKALEKGFRPIQTSQGVTGAFYLRNSKNSIAAIFKPQDVKSKRAFSFKIPMTKVQDQHDFDVEMSEGNDQNIKPLNDEVLHSGIKNSETAIRELAAFVIDSKCNNFASVPETVLVKIKSNLFQTLNRSSSTGVSLPHNENMFLRCNSLQSPTFAPFTPTANEDKIFKTGSLHKFISSDSTAEDFGYSKLDSMSVQKIAAFDILTLNVDRHEGNLLLCFDKGNSSNGKATLIPIDHGLILPDLTSIEDDFQFCWLSWPQTKEKTFDDIRNFVVNLDITQACQSLGNLFEGPYTKEVKVMTDSLKVGAIILKLCVLKFDMTLYEIGKVLCSDVCVDASAEPEQSTLNFIIKETFKSLKSKVICETFFYEFEKKLENHLETSQVDI